MPNSSLFDPEAKYAQLGERVENQATKITDLDNRMRQGFTEIGSQIRSLADDMRGGSRTQWPVIIGFMSVTITVLGGLGYLSLQPIKDNIAQIREDAKIESADTQKAISMVVEGMVTQKEMEWRTARGQEDRARMEASLKELRDGLVPREEHARVWANYDERNKDMQRQIDELKRAQGNVYGARDFLMDMRERLDRMERQKTSGPSS